VGLKRLFKYAFEYAHEHDFKKITFADKPNVMRKSGFFAKKILDQVSKNYPHISFEILNVDAVGLWMVKSPEKFGVIVAENMFGDILSDVGAGVMGGLGFAPSANIGNNFAYFEPVHGSAPAHAGLNKANPSAMFLTIALMLRHFLYNKEADQIEKAVFAVVQENKYVTYDLGGNASTKEMANRIIHNIKHGIGSLKNISFIATGNELVKGEILDTNSQYFSKKCHGLNMNIISQQIITDDKSKIKECILSKLKDNQAIIICGGLGPTSDDKTRYAVAEIAKRELNYNEHVWNYINNRLITFGIAVHQSNRKQALFPNGSEIIENPNGTAYGFKLLIDSQKIIYVLPGPPKECRPMFDNFVLPDLIQNGYQKQNSKHITYKMLGVIESDIADDIDDIVSNLNVETAYRWNYPYLDIKLNVFDINIKEIMLLIEEKYSGFIISKNDLSASDQLSQVLCEKNIPKDFMIQDNLTRGELLTRIDNLKGNDFHYLSDLQSEYIYPCIIFNGLDEYHQKKSFTGKTYLSCKIIKEGNEVYSNEVYIPFRDEDVIEYAFEYASFQILKFIQNDMETVNE
jgi:molybdenum cofactor synthesis domain-containing protein